MAWVRRDELMDEVGSVLIRNWTPLSDTPSSADVTIENLKPVASYSWLKAQEPTIVVPGCPPLWVNKECPFDVPPDQGRPYGDENRCKLPESPLQPLFLAVSICEPELDLKSMDIITDLTNLRNLFRWIEGSAKGDFRIDAQLYKEKVLVLSGFKPNKTYVEGLTRKNLEKAQTKLPTGWDDTFGHHRIVSYNFGGERLLVRHPVDTCDHLPELEPQPPFDMNLLEVPNSRGVKCIQSGELLSQRWMSELTVRSVTGSVPWGNIWHQLYFSQSPILIVAKHNRGTFIEINKFNLASSQELVSKVRESQGALNSLVRLLKSMRLLLGRKKSKEELNNGSSKLSFIFRKNSRNTVEVYVGNYQCKLGFLN